jgi:hypothetical protein
MLVGSWFRVARSAALCPAKTVAPFGNLGQVRGFLRMPLTGTILLFIVITCRLRGTVFPWWEELRNFAAGHGSALIGLLSAKVV